LSLLISRKQHQQRAPPPSTNSSSTTQNPLLTRSLTVRISKNSSTTASRSKAKPVSWVRLSRSFAMVRPQPLHQGIKLNRFRNRRRQNHSYLECPLLKKVPQVPHEEVLEEEQPSRLDSVGYFIRTFGYLTNFLTSVVASSKDNYQLRFYNIA